MNPQYDELLRENLHRTEKPYHVPYAAMSTVHGLLVVSFFFCTCPKWDKKKLLLKHHFQLQAVQRERERGTPFQKAPIISPNMRYVLSAIIFSPPLKKKV